jgi:hypothetical protein
MNYVDVCPIGFQANDCSDDFIRDYVKAWRNQELASCDWTQLSDSPVSNKSEWAAYRQELRDLPEQGPDPKLWVFPVRPA